MNAKEYKEKERASYMTTLFQMISQPKNSEYWREECSNQYTMTSEIKGNSVSQKKSVKLPPDI